MMEWNVYLNGKYVGTVFETSEDAARCAAWSKFDPAQDADLSVARR